MSVRCEKRRFRIPEPGSPWPAWLKSGSISVLDHLLGCRLLLSQVPLSIPEVKQGTYSMNKCFCHVCSMSKVAQIQLWTMLTGWVVSSAREEFENHDFPDSWTRFLCFWILNDVTSLCTRRLFLNATHLSQFKSHLTLCVFLKRCKTSTQRCKVTIKRCKAIHTTNKRRPIPEGLWSDQKTDTKWQQRATNWSQRDA